MKRWKALAQQTYPSDCFEVIVVDDGSTDGTREIQAETFPFTLRYFGQKNQGDAAARNVGAQQSKADILVFLDDDILVEAGYLTHLIEGHDIHRNKIVIGTSHLLVTGDKPLCSKPLRRSSIGRYRWSNRRAVQRCI